MIGDSISTLLREAKKHYHKNGRSYLPWRKTNDPYKIMVSEVMLQQTQVERVLPYYKTFIKRFPTAQSLAKADLPEVLQLWSGLGYNRRGKMLRDAARMIVEKYSGKFPRTADEIETLPGIGPYTARAVAAFAYNSPEVLIETNIRTVFLHHCGHGVSTVSDVELLSLIEMALKQCHMNPREFYAMLMDYGSFLKRSGVKLNFKSKHYTKQSKFQGSRRQLRGAILRLLLKQPSTIYTCAKSTNRPFQEIKEEITKLEKEKMIVQKNNIYSISK